MPLTLNKISETINYMDETYDANFGEWIRNEENCKIVGCNLRKYLEKYRESEFITVVKWIVKDWTLKSIILFAKKLILDDIFTLSQDLYIRRMKILSGLIYTWNPIFISEFLLAGCADFTPTQKSDFMASVLSVFDNQKFTEILAQIENKLDPQVQKDLVKKFKSSIYGSSGDQWKRTNSMLESYKIM